MDVRLPARLSFVFVFISWQEKWKTIVASFFRSAGRKVHFVVGRAKKVEYKIGKKENRTVQYLQGEKSYPTGSAQLRLLYVARSTLPPTPLSFLVCLFPYPALAKDLLKLGITHFNMGGALWMKQLNDLFRFGLLCSCYAVILRVRYLTPIIYATNLLYYRSMSEQK